MENLIVTRHQGTVDWLARQGITGEVIGHANAYDVLGMTVYGVLPLHLASLAERVYTIVMPDLPAEARGQELTPEQMDEYGAVLVGYRVTDVSLPGRGL